jgi:hypothetical protein
VWRSFFRGVNLLYMDNYVGPDSVGLPPTKEATELRAGIGLVRLVADTVAIGQFAPTTEIASTGLALQSPRALLVFAPDATPFTVDLRARGQAQLVEWFGTQSGRIIGAPTVQGGRTVTLQAPTGEGSVLYLRSSAVGLEPLQSIESRAEEIWRNAIHYSPWPIRMKFLILTVVRPLFQDRTRSVLSLCAFFFFGAIVGSAVAASMFRHRSRSTDGPAAT